MATGAAADAPAAVPTPALAMLLAAMLAALLGPAATTATTGVPRSGATTRVIVRGTPGSVATLEAAVTALGGHVRLQLPIINGFAVTLPAGAEARVRALPGAVAVTPDASGRVQSIDPTLGYDPVADTGSLYDVNQLIGAQAAWAAGFTGKGVDVALIDTGVAPVPGLTSGNVVNGPDLSFDSQHADVRYKDAYGHGTHMASIIAGRDTAGTPSSYLSTSSFNGVAPDARVISLKVGASDGSADVSQVIAAINWVTEHAHTSGLNIRVLNLSYGTDADPDSQVGGQSSGGQWGGGSSGGQWGGGSSGGQWGGGQWGGSGVQGYQLDPLTYAAEVAWRKGIVVVAAAGNDGTTRDELADPAFDPNLLAVGAEDPMGTLSADDDTIPAFSNRGSRRRNVDLVAPGTHVLGLRVPNSLVDQAFPSARVGGRFLRGSGTSQATAVVSGAAALLLQKYPTLTPDQLKALLTTTATPLPRVSWRSKGQGLVNVGAAQGVSAAGIAALQLPSRPAYATGTGSLELARGSSHVVDGGVTLSGERDIFGRAWDGSTWAPAALAGTTWSGGNWNGSQWTGADWASGANWAAAPWLGTSWSGIPWTGRSWAARSWVANSWDSRSWADSAWTSRSWADSTWSSGSWS